MKLRHSIPILALLGVIGYAVYAGLVRPAPAPEVTFVSIEGERISTADLRGRVVLVNFWATDCTVCIREMPKMVETYKKHRERGFELIAVAMRYDPPNYVLSYARRNALPFKVALDPMGALAKAFDDVRLTPTTIVIDKRGNIVARILGEPDFADLDRLIGEKLAESVNRES